MALQPTFNPDYSKLDQLIAPLVQVLNQIGLPTYYSCAGIGAGRSLTQYPYPIVVIAPDGTAEQALAFLRFMGILGLFNSNCVSDSDVEWVLEPLGNPGLGIALRPADTGRKLSDLQRGTSVLVYNLKLMNEWYTLEALD